MPAELKPGQEQPAKRLTPKIKWLLTLAVLVGILIGAYLTQALSCAHFTPTGDELYDRYARTVIKREAWRLFHGVTPAALPDAILADWEPDFGNDPRYWQLRYWSKIHGGDSGSPNSQLATGVSSREKAYTYLEESRERGIADATTLLLIYQADRNRWQDELKATDEEDPANYLAAAAQIEADQLDALNELVEAAPDNAWSYYYRARYWFSIGEMDLAAADVIKGNAAAVCRQPKAFPAAFALDHLGDEQPPGNKYLAGALVHCDFSDPLPNWIKWKEHSKEFRVIAALSGRTTGLGAMHGFACRVAAMDNADLIATAVGVEIARLQASYMLVELSDGLSPEQKRTLYAVGRLLQRSRSALRWRQAIEGERQLGSEMYNQNLYSRSGYLYTVSRERHPLHMAAGWLQYADLHLPWRYYLKTYVKAHSDQVFYSESIQPLMQDLALLDYQKLDLPREWGYVD